LFFDKKFLGLDAMMTPVSHVPSQGNIVVQQAPQPVPITTQQSMSIIVPEGATSGFIPFSSFEFVDNIILFVVLLIC